MPLGSKKPNDPPPSAASAAATALELPETLLVELRFGLALAAPVAPELPPLPL